ncbi:multidrug effflux MFS transporter [Candidatus Paracaedibacter symbiosus]|uniref:multidrug effflux MFS transporter n=1 Tax=Candidatus Paracaedibacter symbiosus TaxID=244582 RepID=UPI000509D178|nr:multidrug effflux MFS transporter [Candidatus Paracaedibacter symbiosus]
MENKPILRIACLMVTTYLFSNTVCNPALADIAMHFSAHISTAQNIIILYALGLGISQLIYGPLSDIYGRRIVALAGNSLFVFASIFSLFSSSIHALLLSRFLQGLGAGYCSVIAKSILSDVYKGNFYIRATAVLMIFSVLAQMVAPIIGGYLIYMFSWQANFVAILLYCSITLIILLKFLPETNPSIKGSDEVISTIFRNYITVLRKKELWVFIFLSSLTLSCVTIYYSASPFILQTQVGLSSFELGLTFLLTDSPFIIGCFFIYYMKNKINTRKCILVGLFIMLIGAGLMLLTSDLEYKSPLLLLLPMSVFNLGTGLVFPITTAKALLVHQNTSGASGALIGALQMIIVALLCFCFSRIYSGHQYSLAITLFMITVVCIIWICCRFRRVL